MIKDFRNLNLTKRIFTKETKQDYNTVRGQIDQMYSSHRIVGTSKNNWDNYVEYQDDCIKYELGEDGYILCLSILAL